MGIKQVFIFCFLSVSSLAMTLQAQEHQQYLHAEKLLNKGKISAYYKAIKPLNKHPLLPYLHAKKIKKQFHKTPIEQLDRFLFKYEGQPSARLLQRSWIWHLAKNKKWRLFLEYYDGSENLSLRCHRVTALESTNQHFDALLEGQELWLLGVSLPKACDRVFANWSRYGYLSDDLVWQRLLKAQEKRKYKLVRYLKKKLPSKLRKSARLVQSLWRRPHDIFEDDQLLNLEPRARIILLKKALKYHPEHLFELSESPLLKDLNEQQVALLTRTAVTHGAKISGPQSFPWYEQAKQNQLLTLELEEAFLQGAVTSQNWPLYSHLYKIASSGIKEQAKWHYWQARGLESMGSDHSKSEFFYNLASSERDFYGFMASQKLGVSASMNHDPTHVPASILQRTRMTPSVKRAMAFLEIGRISYARREWQYAFDQFNEDSRQALAVIAGRLDWSDRPIFTLAKQESWHDLQLRFPLAHEKLFEKAARRTHLSQNWIYGVARQESAFMYDARSPVGATGLMQLMPSTAKSVSRRQRLTYSKKRLIEPAYNIKLGSFYLKQLLKRYKGNRVLATAAYNAGPGNVKRWLKKFDGPLDIWIENIPYSETRDYVQRVLTYSTIYSYRLGALQPIFDPTTLAAWSNRKPININISNASSRRNNKG